MQRRDFIYTGFLVLLAVGLAWIYFSQPRIAYIDLPKVYGEFEMKKELESKYKNTTNVRQLILDSLKLQLQQIGARANEVKDHKSAEFKLLADQFNNVRQEYQAKESSFQESDKVLLGQYEKEIWSRINKYAKEYAAKTGVDILLGADGTGNVMNVNTKYELTGSFIQYVNESYQGNK